MAREAMQFVHGDISTSPDPTADINYFMNYALVEPVDTKMGAYFTHQEERYMDSWRVAEQSCDFAGYMADRYRPDIDVAMKIFPPGLTPSNPIKDYRLKVGVVGRVYKSGRKGERHIVKIDVELRNAIVWQFMGEGWTSVPLSAKMEQRDFTNDQDAEVFYRSIDVLLSASELEGGSVPHLEAVKMGVPILTFDVGNSEVWGGNAIICHNTDEMIDVLRGMAEKKFRRYELQQKDWKWFGREHAKLFSRVL